MTLSFSLLLPVLLDGLVPEAQAFCGYYVGGAGDTLTNTSSQVVIARDGRRTTLTLAQDVATNTADFALIVPVPEVMGPDDVREVSAAPLRAIDLYSAPRLVSYPCGDYYAAVLPPPGMPGLSMMGCSAGASMVAGGDSGTGSDGEMLEDSVTVAASYQTGAYDIQVLDAEDAGDLLGWLGENGYAVSSAAESLIQEYLDAGSYFFVAKVRLDAAGAAWLPPLQFSYHSAAFSLPIRLGALNGASEQEMIVYAITDASAGTVGISNYREVDIEQECLLEGEHERGESGSDGASKDFGEFYEAQLDDAFDSGSGWLREYSWTGGSCDPCTGPPFDSAQARELGWQLGTFNVTRLRMRYAPGEIGQDVVFYDRGASQQTQVRYIVYDDGLTPYYPVCDEGMRVVDGEDCYDYGTDWGCCCSGGLAMVGALPLGWALRRRRVA